MKRRSAIWDAICHAIGVPYRTAGKVVSVAAQPPSTVTWTPLTRHFLTGGDTARSALLAATCNNCHGDTGVSSDAAIPNLAGQTVAAIYKQLDDFKSTRRNPPSWGFYVASLSQQDLFDLAAHFASLRNPFVRATAVQTSTSAAGGRLIENGDPMRGIASCAACHGPMGLVPGAPELGGQQRAYTEQQLQAFKAGIRHNDIDEQMRSVARAMTNEEIALLADYYSSFASDTGQ